MRARSENHLSRLCFFMRVVCAAVAPAVSSVAVGETTSAPDDQVYDQRYAPHRWQTSICLPDDPHKSIAGSDGALYYDYGRGPYYGFATRVSAGLAGADELLETVSQALDDPRVPIVETRRKAGGLVLTTVEWAGPPGTSGPAEWAPGRHDYLWARLANRGEESRRAAVELRIDSVRPIVAGKSPDRAVFLDDDRIFAQTWPPPARVVQETPERLWAKRPPAVTPNWANPPAGTDPRFRHVLVGYNGPIAYSFRTKPGEKYTVAFGFIEGWHSDAGIRPLEILVEGSPAQSVDPIRDRGKNRPLIRFATAADHTGDGVVDIAVKSAAGARDNNSILSVLWVFPEGQAPAAEKLLAGGSDEGALAVIDHRHLGAIPPCVLRFAEWELAPGEEQQVLVAVHRGEKAQPAAISAADAPKLRAAATRYWRELDLPYDRIRIPDRAMQGLLDSCIRNIYQARELRDGVPAFQVGPTCYRGMWAADGPFILEAITYLSRQAETRPGLELLARGDEGPQGVEFSKKSGLRVWMILRHTQLTGDLDWLRKMWPIVTQEAAKIREYREMTRKDPQAANYGLMPIGFGDGGLGGKHREYTNVYWNLSGVHAAIEMARLLGEDTEREDWQKEYDDFWQAFRRAAERDKLVDAHGNTYVPVTMKGEQPQLPQRGAWAFLHAIFPGRIFAPDDALMRGTMAMLTATEREGLIYGTGWLPDGIWNYAASFYGHAKLWLGDGRKAAAILYAFANHASPLLCWREEQSLVDDPEKYVGDMPHNWASAEFIRLVRHLLMLERGDELHLLEGLPVAWTKPGAVTMLREVPTTFGDTSVRLTMAADGNAATLEVTQHKPTSLAPVVVHLERFERPIARVTTGGRLLPIRVHGGTRVELKAARSFRLEIEFGGSWRGR